MKRIIFDICHKAEYVVVQAIRVFRDNEDGTADVVGYEPRVLLETDCLDQCRRLVYQIATHDYTREGKWYRPVDASDMEETYIQAKNGRVVKRYIPYRF